MKTSLVGYTGFVGSNIAENHQFTNMYNSKNIETAFGTKPDMLIYAGVSAEKFLANKDPKKDFEVINNAYNNMKKINPKKIVLISTIDVYKNPVDVDEDSEIDINNLQPYGLNRYKLENMVREQFDDYLIIRLPGLYGKNIKKNFIFDLINVIPSMLTETKFIQLCDRDDLIKGYYIKQDNGFFKCKQLTENERNKLKQYFNKIGFSAINFTDSRGAFQFYNLQYLWKHIQIALDNNIKLLNIAIEPLKVSEIYQEIKSGEFVNEIATEIPYYNYKTKYSELFGGKNGYIFEKEYILNDIKKFILQK